MPVVMLLPPGRYQDQILKVVRDKLGRQNVEQVIVNDDVDEDGAICLQVTTVLRNQDVLESRGSQLGDISLAIIDLLKKHRDPRFPYTHYVTRAELKELDRADD